VTTLFAITLFWSAALLFWVEPMIGKQVLPQLGGAPAVWNTCMVFFQGMLLAGYAAAHWMARHFSPRTQLGTYLTLLLAALATLPIKLNERSIIPSQDWPNAWLLGKLLVNVGPAFFVLALTTPLLQRWFADSGHAQAQDPYFLYAASNIGSFVALLSYPIFIEQNWPLREQTWWWTMAFIATPLLVLVCIAKSAFLSRAPAGAKDRGEKTRREAIAAALEQKPLSSLVEERRKLIRRRFHWATCAAVPSSLLLGVTTFITTDVASMPLLWVVPLALYLLTFVFVFARRPIFSAPLLSRVLPIGALALAYQMCAGLSEPAWFVMSSHLIVFFIAAMVCHARLAAERPAPERLTEFYLWMSVGGVLGGLFNTLLAPLLFNSVVEYPLALVAACSLRWRWVRTPTSASPGTATNTADASVRAPGTWLWTACLAVFTAALAAFLPPTKWLSTSVQSFVIFGLPLLLCFLLVDSPRRFALGLGAVFLGATFFTGGFGKTLHVERNFFGVTRVTLSPNGAARQIVHGRTIHGRQFLDAQRAAEPLTFYHREGPLGDVFKVFAATTNAAAAAPAPQSSPAAEVREKLSARSVGVIGLGAGSMAAYASPGERWTFYDIDPSVLRIAQDTNFFTFLNRSAAAETKLIAGDARLRLREAADGAFDLLVLDAFSSDAIPVHLVTHEALKLYTRKLALGGMLAFHISNRYLELEPVLANLATKLQLVALGCDDTSLTDAEFATGREQAHWVVMARNAQDLAGFQRRTRWSPLEGRASVGIWTDDFSSPLKVWQR